jgi:hypothetical protein
MGGKVEIWGEIEGLAAGEKNTDGVRGETLID